MNSSEAWCKMKIDKIYRLARRLKGDKAKNFAQVGDKWFSKKKEIDDLFKAKSMLEK